MFESEIPKYKKKKNSSVSDSRMKSKHKHIYKDCLLVADDRPLKSTYCTICGKVGNVKFFDFVKSENGYSRMLRPDEIYRKYCNLEIKEVSDFYQKYVSTTGGENKT